MSSHLAVWLEAADVNLYLAPGPGLASLALLLALVAGLALAGHRILLVHTPAMSQSEHWADPSGQSEARHQYLGRHKMTNQRPVFTCWGCPAASPPGPAASRGQYSLCCSGPAPAASAAWGWPGRGIWRVSGLAASWPPRCPDWSCSWSTACWSGRGASAGADTGCRTWRCAPSPRGHSSPPSGDPGAWRSGSPSRHYSLSFEKTLTKHESCVQYSQVTVTFIPLWCCLLLCMGFIKLLRNFHCCKVGTNPLVESLKLTVLPILK